MAKNLVLVIMSVLITCVAGEGLLRLMGFRGEISWNLQEVIPIDDPVLNFRLSPNSESFSGNIVYKLNSQGFRDLEHAYQKPANVFRILVLGDSVAFGYKVSLENTFSRKLEGMLRTRITDSAVEVVTLAMPGLNTIQEAHLLNEEGVKYAPDMILIFYSINDADTGVAFARPETICRIELLKWPIPCAYKSVLKSSALLFFVKDRVDSLFWRLNIGDQDDVFGSLRSDYFAQLYSGYEKLNANVLAGFDNIARFSQERELPVVLVVSPIMYEFDSYRWVGIHETIRREGRSRGFQVFDLLDVYRKYLVKDIRVERGDFVHPGDLGHDVAAGSVADFILQSTKLRHLQLPVSQASKFEPLTSPRKTTATQN